MNPDETIPVIAAATDERVYTLTALQQSSRRLRGRLQDIARHANDSANYPSLNTTFLVGLTDRLRSDISEFDTLLDVARWVGCTGEDIRAACSAEWVRITHADTA